MLTLTEVEERHDGCFLVLGWVAFEDFANDLLVDIVEGEGEARVVVFGVAVLEKFLLVPVEEVDGRSHLPLRGFRCGGRRWMREIGAGLEVFLELS